MSADLFIPHIQFLYYPHIIIFIILSILMMPPNLSSFQILDSFSDVVVVDCHQYLSCRTVSFMYSDLNTNEFFETKKWQLFTEGILKTYSVAFY